MKNTQYVRTLDFGLVPIRKTHTEGVIQKVIDLSYDPTHPTEFYAYIKTDFRTNQPFAVLADENMNEITNG